MISRALPLAFLLLTACGSSDTDGGPSAQAGSKVDQALADKLTPAYLKGPWCYTHTIAGDQRSEDMMGFIFSEDGTALYQTNSRMPVENPGSYTINNGHLKVKPKLMFFDLAVETIEPNTMVLKMAFGQTYWRRGLCNE